MVCEGGNRGAFSNYNTENQNTFLKMVKKFTVICHVIPVSESAPSTVP
jgi:hypothetical protein